MDGDTDDMVITDAQPAEVDPAELHARLAGQGELHIPAAAMRSPCFVPDPAAEQRAAEALRTGAKLIGAHMIESADTLTPPIVLDYDAPQQLDTLP